MIFKKDYIFVIIMSFSREGCTCSLSCSSFLEMEPNSQQTNGIVETGNVVAVIKNVLILEHKIK